MSRQSNLYPLLYTSPMSGIPEIIYSLANYQQYGEMDSGHFNLTLVQVTNTKLVLEVYPKSSTFVYKVSVCFIVLQFVPHKIQVFPYQYKHFQTINTGTGLRIQNITINLNSIFPQASPFLPSTKVYSFLNGFEIHAISQMFSLDISTKIMNQEENGLTMNVFKVQVMADYNCRIYFVKFVHVLVREDEGVQRNGDIAVFGNVVDFGVDYTMSTSSPFFLSDNNNASFMLGLITWQGWSGTIGLISLNLILNQNVYDEEQVTETIPGNTAESVDYGSITIMNVGFSSVFNNTHFEVNFGSLIMKRVSLSYFFIGSINCSSTQVYQTSQYPPRCTSCQIGCIACDTVPNNCTSCQEGKILKAFSCVIHEEQQVDKGISPAIYASLLGILPLGVFFMLLQIVIWLILKKRTYLIDMGELQAQPSISFS